MPEETESLVAPVSSDGSPEKSELGAAPVSLMWAEKFSNPAVCF